jgi:hypothetical protein
MIDYDRYSPKHRKRYSLPREKENMNVLSIAFIRQGAHSHLTFIALPNEIHYTYHLQSIMNITVNTALS